jgi:hypothetical protein
MRLNSLTRYGKSPVLLETFGELERFTDACYRAANWIEVGTSKDRGKLEKPPPARPPHQKHPRLSSPTKLPLHP